MIEIPPSNVLDSAHFGYVYCMAMMPSQRTGSDDVALQPDMTYHLLTGGGDETVKVGQMLCDMTINTYLLPDMGVHPFWASAKVYV